MAYESPQVTFPAATHDISALGRAVFGDKSDTSENVILHGYLGARNDLSKTLSFVPLLSTDLKWSIQLVSSAKASVKGSQDAHDKLRSYASFVPVTVLGRLKLRKQPPGNQIGDMQKIQTREIELQDIQLLNEFQRDIIFTPETAFPLEQRHLQLRQDKGLRDALYFRAKVAGQLRKQLEGHNFVEVETPLLFKSTPEGAREFIVPTRNKGLAYALPQSPQQLKQILMASGIPRYYQIARCFRDEDLRADRQPEFTQLDMEMAFASGEDVMQEIESLIRNAWKSHLRDDSNILADGEANPGYILPVAFPRMTYEYAMSKYGSDKPDLRFGMQISQVGHLLPVDLVRKISPLDNPVVETMLFRGGGESRPDCADARKFISTFLDSTDAKEFNENPAGGPGIFVFDSRKPLQGLQSFGFEAAEEIERLLEPEDGDIIVLQARTDAPLSGGSTPLGNLRLALHREAVKQGLIDAPKGFHPVWITDFPLFSPTSDSDPGQGGTAGLSSTHHPFTSPKTAQDVDLLLTDPSSVIGDHYDLVMNGVELGGGSRRIHHAEMQRFIMQDILKMAPERVADFDHLLAALSSGCPPHSGFALGFDRLIAVMLGRNSVKDVIAFPKGKRGEDLMVKSPSRMSEEVLRTYHLKIREED